VKSTKKRFKFLLAEVDRSAVDLRLLTDQLVLLEDVAQLADRVLGICQDLRMRASELHKVEFAVQMAGEENLVELDEIVGGDLISAIEQRFSEICSDEDLLREFLEQLLEKLEACHVAMVQNIQRLLALLAPD